MVLTFGGVFLGIAFGFLLRPLNLSNEIIMIISFPGDILMRLLKMIVLPLIVSSLVTGKLKNVFKLTVMKLKTHSCFIIL